MERLGILGGTFDPPHVGHLWLAETAWQQLNLDMVLFLPAGRPPHKKKQRISPANHRLEMTRLATKDNERFVVDNLDIERPPPHYSVTLLALLHQNHPESLLWLLIGTDSLRDLPTWHMPSEILRFARLGVLPRPGVTVDWVSLSQAVPGVDAAVDVLDGPNVELSATRMRRWLDSGRSLRYLVPSAVLDYIKAEKLYMRASSSHPIDYDSSLPVSDGESGT